MDIDASKAVDRNTATCMRTLPIGRNNPEKTVWWKVDLGGVYSIQSVNIVFANYDGYGVFFYIERLCIAVLYIIHFSPPKKTPRNTIFLIITPQLFMLHWHDEKSFLHFKCKKNYHLFLTINTYTYMKKINSYLIVICDIRINSGENKLFTIKMI